MKYFVFMLMFFISSSSFATAYQTGIISVVYVDNLGHVGIQLQQGFDSGTNAECPGNGGFAGNQVSSKEMTSALLAAKTSRASVTIVTSGCDTPGGWIKLFGLYIQP
jgi:hypothetical protein